MSCWRVLDLSEEFDSEHIPQLLIKPIFDSDSYQVYLTDLSNIWSEELDLDGIVDRASQEQSPIEVSRQDTTQLAILFDHVIKSLKGTDDASCRMTRDEGDGVVLHTSINLPDPLGALSWTFRLKKRPSFTLKNELILPLLVSSHIQHKRIAGLASTIADKDKAITRLVDQYESSNLDLATAFPNIGSLKSGRKMIKREQAAKHVPGLRPFREQAFMAETSELEDSSVTTLGLFQEALTQSTLDVPMQLKLEDGSTAWWTLVPDQLRQSSAATKYRVRKLPIAEPKKAIVESSEDETEDEFETHENFKTRNNSNKTEKVTVPTPLTPENGNEKSDDESTEDEDDLDVPPKNQTKSRTPIRNPPIRHISSPPESPLRPSENPISAMKPKPKGFRIGGKAKKLTTGSSPPEQDEVDDPPNVHESVIKETVSSTSQSDQEPKETSKKLRRPFKIGGKGKSNAVDDQAQQQDAAAQRLDPEKTENSLSVNQYPSLLPRQIVKEEMQVVEEHDETPEEKAERKRAELKRKNEEAARKQAQNKKKKRF